MANTTGTGLPLDLPTGSGFNALQPGITWLYPSDPVVFVGSLSSAVSDSDLRAAFEAFGPVVDAVVMVERGTNISRGFGFVTMGNRKDAPRAIEALHGSELKGSLIVVNVATERR